MVRHIVLFKLQPEHHHEIDGLLEQSRAMKGKIPGLIDLEIGKDFVRSPRSYDIALIATFENEADLDAYATHPVHLPIKTYLSSIAAAVASVDYRF